MAIGYDRDHVILNTTKNEDNGDDELLENDKSDPSTRHDHKDYQGIPWTKGVKVVTPPEVHSHVKGHWNKKLITEDYEYRDKKRKSGKQSFPDHPRTVKRNNESAKEEA